MELPIQIKPEFVDDRGSITKILDDGKTAIKSVLCITSKAGSIRSNHYHKEDSHWIYMIEGSMEYYEKPVEGTSEIKKVVLHAGELIYTPPMTIHTVKFLEDSVFLALSPKSRNQEAYEEDTVRVPLLQ